MHDHLKLYAELYIFIEQVNSRYFCSEVHNNGLHLPSSGKILRRIFQETPEMKNIIL